MTFFNTYKSLRLSEHPEEETTSKSSLHNSKSHICSSVFVHVNGTLKRPLQLFSHADVGTVSGGVSPEGVAEVHAPPFQLLGVVRRHVGKLPEDVEVRGVS